MKVRLNKLFTLAIILQIIATQGVLTFLFFGYLGNWELKKFVHPFSVLLILLLFLVKALKKITITWIDSILLFYFSILFVVLLFNINGFEPLYIVIREVYLVFILIFIFNQLELNKKDWYKILNILFYLLILNSIFILLTYSMGPDKYMEWLTGRYKWGIDPEYKFKISNFFQFWRSPALIGNAGSVAYFSLLAYLFMDQEEDFKNKKYVAVFPLFFSFIRSAYLIFMVYEFLKFFTKKKNLKKLIIIFKVGIPVLILLFIYLAQFEVFSPASLYDRFYLWSNQVNVDFNILFGGAIGNVGGGARGEGFIQTLDSYWFFMFLSSGLVGIITIILFIYEKRKKQNKFLFILISFLLSGLFINLTQSIVFLVLFPLLFIKIKNDESELSCYVEK